MRIDDDFDDFEFMLTCECEPEPIEGNCSAWDPETDAETARWILKELEAGNEWAWCCVTVTTSLEIDGKTYKGFASLGCCSYESEADFRNTDYYSDLCLEAFRDLQAVVHCL